MRGTRGTETSKYPEEKKTKVIPKVVASEIGEAQTSDIMLLGYGLQHVSGRIVEHTWKGGAKSVTLT